MSDGADSPESLAGEPANDEPERRPAPTGRRRDAAGFGGGIWFIGWLFTIGYAELSFGKAFLALFVWPYYLGETLRLATLS